MRGRAYVAVLGDDVLYVEDAAAGLVVVAPITDPGRGELGNCIGDPKQVSVRDICDPGGKVRLSCEGAEQNQRIPRTPVFSLFLVPATCPVPDDAAGTPDNPPGGPFSGTTEDDPRRALFPKDPMGSRAAPQPGRTQGLLAGECVGTAVDVISCHRRNGLHDFEMRFAVTLVVPQLHSDPVEQLGFCLVVDQLVVQQALMSWTLRAV